ncbi:MAG: hypothetical protein FWG66_11050 [Spirochaetes bacterium]|nr:hypothetical protein [Spirochaetota bacterium]
MGSEEPDKPAQEIAAIDLEEDSPKPGRPVYEASPKEVQVEREEARKDADSHHARDRDWWVTKAAVKLVVALIIIYAVIVFVEDRASVSSLLYLLNSVIMLAIGYIFGNRFKNS